MQSKNVILTSRPKGAPTATNFAVEEAKVPAADTGEIQVRNLCMSVDPYMRGRMTERKSYVPPFQIGEVLQGGAIGQVTQSNSDGFAEGDYVESMFGWREGFVAQAGMARNLGNKLDLAPSAYLGILGMPGMTAYVGLLEIGALKEGDTVFVSAAAGAVGSAVGQIALTKGCTVIGSAGGAEKCRYITETLGFHKAINYRQGNLLKQLQAAAPEGVDVYFDNVGGDHLEAAIFCMRPNGRLALCGMISQYNDVEPPPGPRNLIMVVGLGLTLRGFIVSNFTHMRADFVRDMSGWIATGKMKYQETKLQGIDSAPEAFIGLFKGSNTGKMIVEL